MGSKRKKKKEKREGEINAMQIFLKIVGVFIELWKLEPWEIKK